MEHEPQFWGAARKIASDFFVDPARDNDRPAPVVEEQDSHDGKHMDLPRQHTPAPPRSLIRTVRAAVTTGAVSIFCFSIGIAANFAIFAIVQAMLSND